MKNLKDEAKKEIACALLKGTTQRELARIYKVGKGTIQRIKQNISAYLTSNAVSQRRIAKYPDIDSMVFELLLRLREKNIPISGPMLQRAALEYAQMFNYTEFKASSGWLTKFKKRHDISFIVLSGESASADIIAANTFLKNIKPILNQFSNDNIFNCDETALFYRWFSNKSFVHTSDIKRGAKKDKSRITIMLCCSMTGEKLPILILGTHKNPRSMKKYNLKKFNILYKANKNAWMTKDIFFDWINDVNENLKKQNRKILLLLDNCSSHTVVELSNIN